MAEPIRTAASNIVMKGPTPDVGDAWSEADGRTTYLTWELTDGDRQAIADGATLRMGVWQFPMPPVSLEVAFTKPLTDDGARWVDRARAILRRIAVSPFRLPSGYWSISEDVWTALQATGALHNRNGGVPLLAGRPLMRFDDLPADTLLYVSGGTVYNENGPTDEAATPGSLAGDDGSDVEARMGSERSRPSAQDGAE